MPKVVRPKLASGTQHASAGREVLRLLVAMLDGVNGYESETGDLRYWQPHEVEAARKLVDSMYDKGPKGTMHFGGV